MDSDLKLRMYFFVPYNLSEIQKGIQAGHCALEYAWNYGRTELFQEFVKHHKTWIILSGGTTLDLNVAWNHNLLEAGSLNIIEHELQQSKIPFASFREPDLNFALTAVCFIADERVWDFEKYPDFADAYPGLENGQDNFLKYTKMLGGNKNVFIRNLIKDKRLA